MKQTIFNGYKVMCVSLFILFTAMQCPFVKAEDGVPASLSLLASQNQLSKALNFLSTLHNKEEGGKPSSSTEILKITDLESAIKILKTPKDRERVIQVLSALSYVHHQMEKNTSFHDQFKDSLTSFINLTAEGVLIHFRLITQIPEMIIKMMDHFSRALSHETFMDSFLTFLLAFTIGVMVEGMARFGAIKLQNSPLRSYSLYNVGYYIFRHVLPLLLFGIFAYFLIFYSPLGHQTEGVIEKSFTFMTFLIMLRTTFMIGKAVFVSRHIKVEDITKGQPFLISCSPFLIAIGEILIAGIVFAELGKWLGVSDEIYTIWQKILVFGITSLLILTVWKVRLWGISKFSFEDEKISPFSFWIIKLTQFLGRYWYLFISLFIITSFFFYLIGMFYHSLFIAYSTLLTIFVTSLMLWVRNMIPSLYGVFDRLFAKKQGMIASFSKELPISFVNVIQVFLHGSYLLSLLYIWRISPLNLISNSSIHPYLSKGISIGLIIALIRLLWIWTNYIAFSYTQPKKIKSRSQEPSLFTKTITPIFQNICHWALSIIGIILVLEELGIPIMPIVYGISVIGIAISLGAQSLVKDLINGILTLMEGNIAVGETVTIGAHTGVVESLSLRGLSLRHGTGALQTIPFSEVTNIINRSRGYTKVSIELAIPYGIEIEKVSGVLQSAYADTIADPFFQKTAIDPISISGVDRFTDAGFIVTSGLRIKPDPKGRFLKAFNQHLKTYLEREKMTPPSSPTALIIQQPSY